MSNTRWMAVAIGLLGVAVLLASRRRARKQNFGAVSAEWIARQRSEATTDVF